MGKTSMSSSIFTVCGGVLQTLYEEYQCQSELKLRRVIQDSEYAIPVFDFWNRMSQQWKSCYTLLSCELSPTQKQWFASEIIEYNDLHDLVFLCLKHLNFGLLKWMFLHSAVPETVLLQVDWESYCRYFIFQEPNVDAVLWLYQVFSFYMLTTPIVCTFLLSPFWYKLKPHWNTLCFYVSDWHLHETLLTLRDQDQWEPIHWYVESPFNLKKCTVEHFETVSTEEKERVRFHHLVQLLQQGNLSQVQLQLSPSEVKPFKERVSHYTYPLSVLRWLFEEEEKVLDKRVLKTMLEWALEKNCTETVRWLCEWGHLSREDVLECCKLMPKMKQDMYMGFMHTGICYSNDYWTGSWDIIVYLAETYNLAAREIEEYLPYTYACYEPLCQRFGLLKPLPVEWIVYAYDHRCWEEARSLIIQFQSELNFQLLFSYFLTSKFTEVRLFHQCRFLDWYCDFISKKNVVFAAEILSNWFRFLCESGSLVLAQWFYYKFQESTPLLNIEYVDYALIQGNLMISRWLMSLGASFVPIVNTESFSSNLVRYGRTGIVMKGNKIYPILGHSMDQYLTGNSDAYFDFFYLMLEEWVQTPLLCYKMNKQ